MKKLLFTILLLILSIDANNRPINKTILYEVDMTNAKDDLFHVKVKVDGLSKDNDIYNFASNVPGTYQISDFGRFVKSFQAYDIYGKELGTTRLSTNRWRIRNSKNVTKIVYSIEDTYDAIIDSNDIYPMSGTGIQDDFIVLNTFGVLGFFEGMQSNPIELAIKYNNNWEIGTSLRKNDAGNYYAESFDRLADSPILIGDLSRSTVMVNDIEVNIHTYSTIPDIDSDFIMKYVKEILLSAGDFIGYSPVPNYDFLFTLLDYDDFVRIAPKGGGGALEHSLSSFYFLTGTKDDVAELKHIMAHEFLHILSPLNLHSEIIHYYNFKHPTPSKHIWLYEGVTEWASDMMQLQSGILSIDDYLKNATKRLIINEMVDPGSEISLVDMSKGVFDPDTSEYFYNFYQKGALAACLLDIQLLELSGGKYGLMNLYLDLLNDYGKYRPFPEKEFFDIIIDKTYPEIGRFIDQYIIGNNKLPIEEYFEKIGITYIEEKLSEDTIPWFGFRLISYNGQDYTISNTSEYASNIGLLEGDQVLKVFGMDVNGGTFSTIKETRNKMEIGHPFEMTILRNGERIQINGNLQKKIEYHIFTLNPDATEDQIKLRSAWMGNEK